MSSWTTAKEAGCAGPDKLLESNPFSSSGWGASSPQTPLGKLRKAVNSPGKGVIVAMPLQLNEFRNLSTNKPLEIAFNTSCLTENQCYKYLEIKKLSKELIKTKGSIFGLQSSLILVIFSIITAHIQQIKLFLLTYTCLNPAASSATWFLLT